MRKLPPLGSLRAFEAAARLMSFRKAATELGVTPTAISHQIRLLEEVCGQLLFRRRPRPLVLTGVGERQFPVICSGFDAFAAAIASASAGVGQRPLRVTSPNAFASRWLVPRLSKWREQHPNIPLEIIGTDAVLDLQAGDADVAIRYARRMPRDVPAQEIFGTHSFRYAARICWQEDTDRSSAPPICCNTRSSISIGRTATRKRRPGSDGWRSHARSIPASPMPTGHGT